MTTTTADPIVYGIVYAVTTSPPRYDKAQGKLWARGWNARLTKIKEMRDDQKSEHRTD